MANQQRDDLCVADLRKLLVPLNQPLAPDAYLKVLPLVVADRGARGGWLVRCAAGG